MSGSAVLELRLEGIDLNRRPVVGQVQLTCAAGEHTVILGPNGAGKTTLLRAIVGLIPFRGSAKLNGRELAEISTKERARLVAYVPQRSSLAAALHVRDVVMQGRFAHRPDLGAPSARDREVVERALRQADIEAFSERVFTRLSGGEQRRVLLARALATEARVIVLDEPTSFLDIAHSIQLFNQLNQLRADGHTVISVLHDLSDAERFGDQSLVLQAGQVRHLGKGPLPAALIESVYGVRAVPNSAPSYELLAGP
jgi:iron complex transport system ATP-binding protein